MDTETNLLLAMSQGSEKAFKLLFDKYRDRLFHFIDSIVKSKQVSEELVMDVFLKIWLSRKVAVEIRHFEAFLFQVARNKAIDFFRKAAKDPKFQDLIIDRIACTRPDVSRDFMIEKEYDYHLRMAVGMLSPQRKKVYALSREQEMTHGEIARQLQLSKSTVNNHLVEAQRFVRGYLMQHFDLGFWIIFAGMCLV